MKVQIRRLDVNQVGALTGYLTGFLILLFSPIAIFKAIKDNNWEIIGMIPLVLLFYTAISFFMGMLMAKLYNRAAKKVGGLKIELDVEPVPSEPESVGDF